MLLLKEVPSSCMSIWPHTPTCIPAYKADPSTRLPPGFKASVPGLGHGETKLFQNANITPLKFSFFSGHSYQETWPEQSAACPPQCWNPI